LTLVRHGESTDNLRAMWAGWKDAPLSNHGLNQARATGKYFSTTRLHTIVTSPLKRALTTAQQIHKQQPEATRPPLISSPLIREQHFGEAEGQPWAASIVAEPSTPISQKTTTNSSNIQSGRLGIVDPKTQKKSYPVQVGRKAKFPAGESLDDVAQRTGEAFETFVMPVVRMSEGKGSDEVHVMFVSHGIAISETIRSMFARAVGGDKVDPETWRGLENTGWTRLVIGMRGENLESVDVNARELRSDTPDALKDTGAQMATAVETASPLDTSMEVETEGQKELVARIVAVNRHSHLEGIVRQKGGIGSMAYDENQQAITDFFGGGGNKQDKPAPTAADRTDATTPAQKTDSENA